MTSNERLALGLFGGLALLGLMGILFGALAPTGNNGQIRATDRRPLHWSVSSAPSARWRSSGSGNTLES